MDTLTIYLIIGLVWFLTLIATYTYGVKVGEDIAEENYYLVEEDVDHVEITKTLIEA